MSKNDTQTSLEEVKGWVQGFCDERGWEPYHGAKDLAIGLITESSELLELFRFQSEKDVDRLIQEPAFRAQAADELADSLYFILRFAQKYDFDLATCLKEKLIKNAVKYPAPV